MAKTHERTLQMMANFIRLHNDGHTIKEIAEMFNLSTTTVYTRLPEIAEKEGLAREELLERLVIADHSGRNFTPVKPIDRADFKRRINEAREAILKLQEAIKKTIEEIEAEEEYEEED